MPAPLPMSVAAATVAAAAPLPAPGTGAGIAGGGAGSLTSALLLQQQQALQEQLRAHSPDASQAEKPVADLNLRLLCRDCKDQVPNIVEDFSAGDLICGNCGLVLGNRIIDTRSEWRTFSNSDENSLDPSRVGAVSDPFFGAEGQIDSTAISYRDGGSGRARELSRAHARVVNQKSEAALTQAFRLIHTMGERISLSKVVLDSAKQLFKKADEERTLRSRPLEAVIAACLYIACHEQHVNRTFKEICALTKVSKKEIGKCYKALQHLMEHPAQAATLDSHINRFASLMEMHPEVSRAAVLVTARVTDLGILAGKSPITQVASCLFFVSCMSSDPKPARYIAEVSGCTEPTLKNAYRLLYDSRVELAKDLVLPRGIEALPMP